MFDVGVFSYMREWIETNGLGGYASLTQKEEMTRKFHGLLIASRHPPVERWVFISNITDTLFFDETQFSLKGKATFSFDLVPTWTYNTPIGEVKKRICMPHERSMTIIRYDVSLKKKAFLTHDLMINSRHFYDTHLHSPGFSYELKKITDEIIQFSPKNVQETIKVYMPDASFNPVEQWQPLTYELDCDRNDSCQDHILHLGKITQKIKQNHSLYLIFTTEQHIPSDVEYLFSEELKRRKNVVQKAHLPENMKKLVLATDRFIVKKPPYHTILAGYHWFSDWGRDTLIALPGITLVTNRFQIARNILEGIATYTKKGIIPNTFDDRDSSPAYNTVDASLWYLDRVFQYLKYTNDKQFINSYYDTFQSIISAYQHGTHHHIFMDEDYLISHDPGLTWMDVKLGQYYPTPRARKAVEIQALWYNALKIMSVFADLTDKENPYTQLADRVKESFHQQFDAFYDVIDKKDTSLRPNIIFLASLDYSMISSSTQKQIIDIVQDHLLTIFGLRTLDAADPQYKPTYLGEYPRDLAYHNGTVWPWLLGSFIKAKARIHQKNSDWKSKAFEDYLLSMIDVYGDKWDGSVHEIFDAEPPFIPRGCMSQAWSVAEILRAWVEDILGKRPPYEDVFLSKKIQTL